IYDMKFEMCNGLLLDNSKVLTSRGCAIFVNQQVFAVEDFYAKIGDHDLTSTTETKSKTVAISKITVPLQNGIYDTKDAFAILHLSEELELSENIRPICLPVSHNEFDDGGVVTGWEFSIFGPSDTPNEANVVLVDDTEFCNATLHALHEAYNSEGLYEMNLDIDYV
ncbi:unnamed protein product, partial [Meganyctiphanes norvegica]